ncbi:hypothetical protein [Citricoccus sp.]|uniref:hypothetical protein n=1 Tax=Citricoccus sp. TaxID=1978372 RepID=UPI0028BE5DC9|nr:hypothetical protein [Citricoccus sp.]
MSMALLVLTRFAVGAWWFVPGAPGAGAVVLNVLIVGFLVWQALRWTPARDRPRTKA